ncbi:carbon-nitrogen hydrolase family protein [Pseudooceanicola sp. CBS1P-1]|uniref:Carbon-nitrogen hydrolase family protein n=1 Tax=Pseudooceanicola albus TaxID=2692189 RepID=A0A6L7G6V9_9RHOB|nr:MULTISPECIES: carbon-nitrogen hydrolase family protein [Pseudooceanicola]MBT9385900.1 carbon-nitrogen hydrolase family protein [Pseudooceanicola endophyticus]MXN19679.1 carbon-nitrogen hydrolase family protein [Pseudooceanicola albus]
MTDTLRILACQIDIPAMTTAAERDAHLARVSEEVRRQLRDRPADLVVLPELASIDYSRAAFDNLDALAEPLDGASFRCWSEVAREHGIHVVYGFARDAGETAHICMGAVDPQGRLVGHYDKLHLAQYGASMEKDYFTRGDHLLVLEVAGFRVAPIICYDIRIPELCRTLVLDHGVDAILHCGAYFRDVSFHTWHDFAVSRAIENQCYFLSLNRAGADYGQSLFCHPWHDETLAPTAFPAHAEAFLHLRATREEITSVRETYSFLRDRLDSYLLPVTGSVDPVTA